MNRDTCQYKLRSLLENNDKGNVQICFKFHSNQCGVATNNFVKIITNRMHTFVSYLHKSFCERLKCNLYAVDSEVDSFFKYFIIPTLSMFLYTHFPIKLLSKFETEKTSLRDR